MAFELGYEYLLSVAGSIFCVETGDNVTSIITISFFLLSRSFLKCLIESAFVFEFDEENSLCI